MTMTLVKTRIGNWGGGVLFFSALDERKCRGVEVKEAQLARDCAIRISVLEKEKRDN